MARSPYASDIKVEYDGGSVDIIRSYSFLLKEFKMSKRFPDYLGNAVQRVADRRFNAYMTANAEEHKHMFEWGTKGTTQASRLWITQYAKGLISYAYLPSRKLVPAKLPHTKYRHVFENKAKVMEEAPVVIIEPKKAKYLRWRGGVDGEEVRSYNGIIVEVAGAKFKNKFQNTFLIFWATGAGGTMAEMKHAIESSPTFQFEYKKNQIIGLKRRIKGQQKKANATNDAKTKAMAQQRVKELERAVTRLGGTL